MEFELHKSLAAEQKLLREVRNLLAEPHAAEPTHGRHVIQRRQNIHAAMDFVEQHDGECLSMEQLATAPCVSERTLRDAFLRYFGVPPVQYLNRRSLHQIRNALLAADPSTATVTEIATHFGVWHFGRLAKDYRFLFDELPSQTLRHDSILPKVDRHLKHNSDTFRKQVNSHVIRS